jgi:ketosteroid isomerase-like protein
MRGTLIFFTAILLAACDRPAAKQDNADQSKAESELKAANLQYDKALIDGDAASLDRFYTDDFQIIDDDAEVHDKTGQIAFMTQSVDLLNAKSDDVQVKMLGPDAALLTGRFTGRYRLEGKENDFTERYSSVWVRDGARWRVKHEHSSVVPRNREEAPQ